MNQPYGSKCPDLQGRPVEYIRSYGDELEEFIMIDELKQEMKEMTKDYQLLRSHL